MTERVYVVIKETPNFEIDCVLKSMTAAEQYCLEQESKNPDFIYYWRESFLTDEP